MKRIIETANPATPAGKVPTIGQLLNAMAPDGIDTYEDRLFTYSNLGYHFDGTDYSAKSVKVVSALISRMDAATPELDIQPIEDEDADRYGFRYQGSEYWLTSPSIRNMPKLKKGNIPGYYRELVEKLADDQAAIMALPYYCFGALGDVLGKCLGIA